MQSIYLWSKLVDARLHQWKRDGKYIFKLTDPYYAETWHPDHLVYPVMLAIQTSDGQIRWMNVSDYLAEHGKQTKQVIFDGEPFIALNLVEMRNRLLS